MSRFLAAALPLLLLAGCGHAAAVTEPIATERPSAESAEPAAPEADMRLACADAWVESIDGASPEAVTDPLDLAAPYLTEGDREARFVPHDDGTGTVWVVDGATGEPLVEVTVLEDGGWHRSAVAGCPD
ncbi:hypothetical protein [Nocardioides sp.]|uniref:hypothetical protein n=1 Tax=Nocardioides sp. TaxID=35761 RepID=UPI00351840EA